MKKTCIILLLIITAFAFVACSSEPSVKETDRIDDILSYPFFAPIEGSDVSLTEFGIYQKMYNFKAFSSAVPVKIKSVTRCYGSGFVDGRLTIEANNIPTSVYSSDSNRVYATLTDYFTASFTGTIVETSYTDVELKIEKATYNYQEGMSNILFTFSTTTDFSSETEIAFIEFLNSSLFDDGYFNDEIYEETVKFLFDTNIEFEDEFFFGETTSTSFTIIKGSQVSESDKEVYSKYDYTHNHNMNYDISYKENGDSNLKPFKGEYIIECNKGPVQYTFMEINGKKYKPLFG